MEWQKSGWWISREGLSQKQFKEMFEWLKSIEAIGDAEYEMERIFEAENIDFGDPQGDNIDIWGPEKTEEWDLPRANYRCESRELPRNTRENH